MSLFVEIGLNALKLIKNPKLKKPALSKELFKIFFAEIIHKIIEDQIVKSPSQPDAEPRDFSLKLIDFFYFNTTGRNILYFYLFSRIKVLDYTIVSKILGLFNPPPLNPPIPSPSFPLDFLNCENHFIRSLLSPSLTVVGFSFFLILFFSTKIIFFKG